MLRTLSLLIVLAGAGFLVGCNAQGPPPAPPKKNPVVQVSLPLYEDVTDYEEFTGRMEAFKSVDIRARVTGYLKKQCFKDGDEVRKNQVLFEIDPRPFDAALAQAEANLRLAEADSNLQQKLARRAEDLYARKAMSREDYETAQATYEKSLANVGALQAARDSARLNVTYTKVVAPIAGRISRRFLDEGNTVKADDTMLTTIVALDPMYVYFDINERCFQRLQRLVKDKVIPSLQDNRTPVLFRLADEKKYEHTGTIDFEDNRLDNGTGTRRLRAVVDNYNHFFAPGLFVRVRLPVGKPHRALLMAEEALQTDQGQKFVFVVSPKGVVESRPVQVGRVHRGLREILPGGKPGEGLKPGEKVVVKGLQRIRQGVEATAEVVKMPDPTARRVRPVAPAAGPVKDKPAASRTSAH